MHSQLRTHDHQGIAHVVARVAHVGQLYAFQMPEMLPYCQHVREHLCGVVFIGESIPYRNACMLCKLLHDCLLKPAVLNSIKHSAKHARRVRNRLFFANLGARRVKVCRPHAKIMRCHLKRTARACTGLLKNQCNIFAAQRVVQDAFFLFVLIFCRQIYEICNLFRRKIL